jgi:hypothetical protein
VEGLSQKGGRDSRPYKCRRVSDKPLTFTTNIMHAARSSLDRQTAPGPQEKCSWGRPWSAQEHSKPKALSLLVTAVTHKYRRGDFPRNFSQPLKCFISHCLQGSTVKAAADTGCSPQAPTGLLPLPLHAGKLALQDPRDQGIRSVSQLVRQGIPAVPSLCCCGCGSELAP